MSETAMGRRGGASPLPGPHPTKGLRAFGNLDPALGMGGPRGGSRARRPDGSWPRMPSPRRRPTPCRVMVSEGAPDDLGASAVGVGGALLRQATPPMGVPSHRLPASGAAGTPCCVSRAGAGRGRGRDSSAPCQVSVFRNLPEDRAGSAGQRRPSGPSCQATMRPGPSAPGAGRKARFSPAKRAGGTKAGPGACPGRRGLSFGWAACVGRQERRDLHAFCGVTQFRFPGGPESTIPLAPGCVLGNPGPRVAH